MKARRPPVALLAALLAPSALVVLPAGGSAAPASTATCPAILAPRPAIELPVQVAPGLSVRVRDPYGGLIARNRLFVAFSVRYPNRADRARVAAVTWTLDGAAPRRDEGGRDQLLAPSTMYSAGRHVVGVRIQPVGGGPAVEAELQVTATDCRLASLSQRPDGSGGLELAVASGGPGVSSIELRAGAGRFGAPRGGRLGTVALSGGRTRALRASALSRGGRALRIGGLPHGTTAVRVHLAPGVVSGGHRCSLSAWLRASGGAPPVRVVQRC
ncbi:MAG TPA: hypothetical protein VLK59_04275 [Solirubrobacteraceae bacterium]|nr:hypothetical protein [Solirubrobacteraceae bacterium]